LVGAALDQRRRVRVLMRGEALAASQERRSREEEEVP
jgi:uncharacterized protein (DUF427 family)